jgi:hypothetical protein
MNSEYDEYNEYNNVYGKYNEYDISFKWILVIETIPNNTNLYMCVCNLTVDLRVWRSYF